MTRYFAPAWNVRAAEDQLRAAHGQEVASQPDEEVRARTQPILLAALTANLGLTEPGLDGLLSDGRASSIVPAR